MLTKIIALFALIAMLLFSSYLYFTKGWGMQVHSWLWFFVFGFLIPAFITPIMAKVQAELIASFKGN